MQENYFALSLEPGSFGVASTPLIGVMFVIAPESLARFAILQVAPAAVAKIANKTLTTFLKALNTESKTTSLQEKSPLIIRQRLSKSLFWKQSPTMIQLILKD